MADATGFKSDGASAAMTVSGVGLSKKTSLTANDPLMWRTLDGDDGGGDSPSATYLTVLPPSIVASVMSASSMSALVMVMLTWVVFPATRVALRTMAPLM